jgi:hypothetical protein
MILTGHCSGLRYLKQEQIITTGRCNQDFLDEGGKIWDEKANPVWQDDHSAEKRELR